MHGYRPPRWLGGAGAIGGNLQTIWPALRARRAPGAAPGFRRERWTTPDGDFVDTDWLDLPLAAAATGTDGAPLLVLFHGLEGSSRSHYALAFAGEAARRGWRYAVPHFRGCSGELNLAPRAYHSGDHEEIDWMLAQLSARHAGPLLAVGVSLGGNALLRWAEEAGETASSRRLRAVAAVSAPLDLAAAGHAIGQGFNRLVYTPYFLRTMQPKAVAKWRQHPGLFDLERARAATDLYAFDDAFTAPLHGFRGVDDYWRRASAAPGLARIRLPALVLNARNDPFVPVASLPARVPGNDRVQIWQPPHGGHVGFPAAGAAAPSPTLPSTVCDWLVQAL